MILGRILRKAASFFRLSTGSDGREKVAFFIEYCEQYDAKLKSLASDHEPDEIPTAMMLYEKQIRTMAEFSMREHSWSDRYRDEYVIDNIPPAERERRFFQAIEWADSHEDVYSRMPPRAWLMRAFVDTYGKPSDASARKLKAEAVGDYEMSEAL